MDNPLVSIIVPSYNHENFIEKALKSALNQTYNNIEIIVLDDGSRDQTSAVALDVLKRYKPSHIFIQQENMGAAHTINKAIKLSSGRYFNILNSDDFFDETRIEKCVRIADRFNLDFIFTKVSFVDDNSAVVSEDEYVKSLLDVSSKIYDYPSLGFAFLKNQIAISTGNMFFSRRLLDKVGFFRSYSYVHDWDFVLRSIFFTEPYYLNECLYHYRIHRNNSYKTLGEVEGYETFEVMSNALQSLVKSYPENPRAPSYKYWPGTFERFIREHDYHIYLPPRLQSKLYKGQLLK